MDRSPKRPKTIRVKFTREKEIRFNFQVNAGPTLTPGMAKTKGQWVAEVEWVDPISDRTRRLHMVVQGNSEQEARKAVMNRWRAGTRKGRVTNIQIAPQQFIAPSQRIRFTELPK